MPPPPLTMAVWFLQLPVGGAEITMATQTLFSSGMFPVGVSLAEDGQGFSDLPRNMLPAPQLVMLANVAAVTAPEVGDSSVAEEKEMMELKTVGSSYSDSEDEDEGVIR